MVTQISNKANDRHVVADVRRIRRLVLDRLLLSGEASHRESKRVRARQKRPVEAAKGRPAANWVCLKGRELW